MMHDENCNPMTKDNRTHAQVTKCSNSAAREEIKPLSQCHDINTLNREMLNHDANEAQTLEDMMCDVNQTFRSESCKPMAEELDGS